MMQKDVKSHGTYLACVRKAVRQYEIWNLQKKGAYDLVLDNGPLGSEEMEEMEKAFGYVNTLPDEHPFRKDVTQEKVEAAYDYFKSGRLRKDLVACSSSV